MRCDLEIGGRLRQVTVSRHGNDFVVLVDGRARHVRAARVDAHTLSLLLEDGASHDVIVTAEPGSADLAVCVDGTPVRVTVDGQRRWRAGGDAGHAGGAQRIVAPMPGKIVRVLVKPGDTVRARQPVVVVEAMKMESELRALGDGMVAEVPAREGLLVEAGAVLVLIAPEPA